MVEPATASLANDITDTLNKHLIACSHWFELRTLFFLIHLIFNAAMKTPATLILGFLKSPKYGTRHDIYRYTEVLVANNEDLRLSNLKPYSMYRYNESPVQPYLSAADDVGVDVPLISILHQTPQVLLITIPGILFMLTIILLTVDNALSGLTTENWFDILQKKWI